MTRKPNKARWVGSKPAKKRAAKVAPKAVEPEVPKDPDTLVGLLLEMNAICDQVDAAMATERTTSISFQGWYNSSTLWGKLHEEKRKLHDRIWHLLDDDPNDERNPEEFIEQSMKATAGSVPSWSRPGAFLIWCGPVPFACQWGGYFQPHASFQAADPRRPFVNTTGDLRCDTVISHEATSVEDHFRRELLRMTRVVDTRKKKPVPAFVFRPLSEMARKELAEAQALMPWLADALKYGPVDPVPLPPHIKSVPFGLL